MKLLLIILLLTSCAKGPKGDTIIGPKGATGSDGQTIVGPQGDTGPAGADGMVVTVVKFCPETASYPSAFPEVGICLSGVLYAVYSANGGFLALIPDGAYSSNGIGSSCNFVVAGCTITH